MILMTGVIGSSSTNVQKTWGYGDRYNGIFFRQDQNGFAAVLRSSATGVLSERVVYSQNFNGSPIDGTAHDQFVLDLSSGNIFMIDFEWLGVGDVRLGIVHDHEFHIVHTFKNSNAFNHVYMNTANLPVHYEIKNTGASSGGKMMEICSSVLSEGGDPPVPVIFSTSTAVTTTAVTTRRPVLSIRPMSSFRGLENRGKVVPHNFSVISTNGVLLFYEIVKGGTLGSASFSVVHSSSIAEADRSATTITGGTIIEQGYVNSAGTKVSGSTEGEFRSRVPITVDFNGQNPDALSIVITSMGASADVAAGLQWEEYR